MLYSFIMHSRLCISTINTGDFWEQSRNQIQHFICTEFTGLEENICILRWYTFSLLLVIYIEWIMKQFLQCSLRWFWLEYCASRVFQMPENHRLSPRSRSSYGTLDSWHLQDRQNNLSTNFATCSRNSRVNAMYMKGFIALLRLGSIRTKISLTA